MRLLLMILSVGLVVAQISPVDAATKKAKASVSAKKQKSDLSTNHDFDDQSVVGEYQMPDEALAKVENEKLLGDLLGVRKHFKDRLLEASEQE